MQGDIRPPQPKRPRPPLKPKPQQHYFPPQADEVIYEAQLEQAPARGRKNLKSNLLTPPHHHFIRFWRWWLKLSRNERFAVIAVALLIFGVFSILWVGFIKQPISSDYTVVHHPKPKPKAPITAASPLTGVQVDPSLAGRPVTGIMIENSDDARPQSGLQDAGVVYEAIAEGGVTRFLALFQESTPQYIGPVRSLRPYYIDFAAPFQASIAHVGGSPDALSIVRSGGYRDLDQFFNSGAYSRVSTRPAPHNVYTSFAKLDALNQAKGYTTSSFTSWGRKADKKLAVPTAKNIQLAISGSDFHANYTYDPASNSYLRSEGGAAHMDLPSAGDKTGVQLRPKVVIGLVMGLSRGELDASGAYYSDYQDTGSGAMYVFQDGDVIQGTWSKAGTSDQFIFADSAGAPIKLDAGQTWITVLSGTNQITYTP
jgi:hypothetical protein